VSEEQRPCFGTEECHGTKISQKMSSGLTPNLKKLMLRQQAIEDSVVFANLNRISERCKLKNEKRRKKGKHQRPFSVADGISSQSIAHPSLSRGKFP